MREVHGTCRFVCTCSLLPITSWPAYSLAKCYYLAHPVATLFRHPGSFAGADFSGTSKPTDHCTSDLEATWCEQMHAKESSRSAGRCFWSRCAHFAAVFAAASTCITIATR